MQSFSPLRARAFSRTAAAAIALVFVAAAWPYASRAYLKKQQQRATGGPDPATWSPVKDDKDTHDIAPGQILVRFRTDAAAAKGQRTSLSLHTSRGQVTIGVERFGGSSIVDGLRVARVAAADTSAAIDALRSRPDVIYAEPNRIRRAQRSPNDSLYSQMWGLKNFGQSVTSGGNPGVPGNDIRAEQAWDVTTGNRSIVVGVIDEGIDINHPDLQANVWVNPAETAGNGIDDDGNGYVDDINGWDFAHNDNTVFDYTEPTYPPADSYDGDVDDHGTHVAGTIGAVGDNGIGVTGVNWQVSLMSLKFLVGVDGFGTSADALEAYAYAKSMRELWTSSAGTKGANIRVLNNSYGGFGSSQAELDAIRALGDVGILFVASAGNEGQNNDIFPSYPANYRSSNLVSVASTTGFGTKSSFSNFGWGSVHLAAPGSHILSTTPKNTYNFFSGTSMAAPHVAGGAALLLAAQPGLSLSKLRSSVLYGGYGLLNSWHDTNSYIVSSGRAYDANGTFQSASSSDVTAPGAISPTGQSANFPQLTMNWTATGDDGNSGRVAAYEVRIGSNDLTNPANFQIAAPLAAPIVQDAGAFQNFNFRVPWRHPNSNIAIRAVDEAGNAGPIATIPLGVAEAVAEPYLVTTSAPTALTTGGTALNFQADDEYRSVGLPFPFPLFNSNNNFFGVQISSNGALYFSSPPLGATNDAFSSVTLLNGHRMIAGAWDDLRTDRRPGDDVYMVTPNEDTVIFRWQAVTFDTPIGPSTTRGENPVNFEIELRRNGTIILRYGDGNQKLFPVVGIGGGFPEAYVVNSHTSETALKDLTNAQTVTFTLRVPPPPPTANLQLSMTAGPNPVPTGGEETFNLQVFNNGPFDARNTSVTDTLPAGLNFVSCTTSRGTCSGPTPGTNGTVQVNIGTLDPSQSASITIVTTVVAPAGSSIMNTASVLSTRLDNDLSNNAAFATFQVIGNTPFDEVKAIAASTLRSFAVRQDGVVWSWGKNDFGALGDGNPVFVIKNRASQTLSTDAVSVAAGFGHTLALKTDGTVHGWGANGRGQIVGTNPIYPSPLIIPSLTNITAVAAGFEHSLALRNDGVVLAWGANDVGQLGQGTTDVNAHNLPTPVPGLNNVIAIAAGNNHSIALRNDGTVWAWGNNINGQLGVAGGDNFRSSPVQVPGVSGVQAIGTGYHHVLAVKSDGTVWGWGMNAFGQTGSTNFVNTNPTPTQVPGITNATAVTAGWGFSIALKSDGTVWGWGLNSMGQLGTGTTGSNPQTTPTQVTGLSSVTKVAAGDSHVLALLSNGTMRGWGDNQNSQIGDGTNFNRVSPAQVLGLMVVADPTLQGTEVSSNPINVTVRCMTPGAVIHYTLNGLEPSQNDPTVVSNGTVQVTQTLTFKARAFRNGWSPSAVVSRKFTILTGNPIDTPSAFVRQHYIDFLAREPDQGGWDYWTAQLTSCGNDVRCIHERRIGVSAAFFIELEFQRTGYVVYRVHRAAFGTWSNAPTRANLTYPQFTADRALLPEGGDIAQTTINFANGFVLRPEFLNLFPATQTNEQFVNKLFDTATLTPYATERQQQIDAMNNGKTRAQVLLDLIEIPEFKTREYNRSFVLMEYFGYLRRDPDQGGYDFWLNVLDNREPNNFRGMVCSFITSAEYQQRFGSEVTRTNQDCQQP